MADQREAIVPDELGGERLDRILPILFPDLSRTSASRLIEAGDVLVDERPAKPSQKTKSGALVCVTIPPPLASQLEAEDIGLAISYADADVLVVDKPAGLVVHPAPGHATGTLVNALLAYDPTIRIGDELRPGIVHRLDKDTSGLLMVARNERALRELQRQMKDREIVKEYLALVQGQPPSPRGVIDAPIGRDPRRRQSMAIMAAGREARTHFEIVESLENFTLVRVRLETGRTHQIRVHFSSIGCPVAGDPVYASGRTIPGLSRHFLHATRLTFKRPSDGEEVTVTSPLPADLTEFLTTLRGRTNQKT